MVAPTPRAFCSAQQLRASGKVFAAEVCELLDCRVRADYLDDEGLELAFAIGEPATLDEGLHGFRASPYFGTGRDMEDFCKKNIQGFREVDLKRDGVPEPWFWEARGKHDWRHEPSAATHWAHEPWPAHTPSIEVEPVERTDPVLVAVITLGGEKAGYTVPMDHIRQALDDIDDGDAGSTYSITVKKIPCSKYEALGEFDGF